jgi:hypothetical protein
MNNFDVSTVVDACSDAELWILLESNLPQFNDIISLLAFVAIQLWLMF